MKSGFHWIVVSVLTSGLEQNRRRCQRLSLIPTRRRWCSPFRGVGKVSSLAIHRERFQQWTPTSTLFNLPSCRLNSAKIGPDSSSGEALSLSRMTQDLASQTRLFKKSKTLAGSVLTHPPYSPDYAPSDYHFFRSLQHSLALDNLPMWTRSKCPSMDFSRQNHKNSKDVG